jgi:hypothetical protein
MKRIRNSLSKYITGLLGSAALVLVVQYALLTAWMEPIHPVFSVLQVFCYMLLGVSIFRGFIKRSRLAWLIAQMMLSALFAVSLLFATVTFVLMLQDRNFGIMLLAALLAAVLDGLMLGILFSLPVCDYFQPRDEDPLD